MNFRDAANLCGSGQLAVIKSERENNYIRKMLSSVLVRTEETVWIGAYKHTEGLSTFTGLVYDFFQTGLNPILTDI